jgi:hypothetical protein
MKKIIYLILSVLPALLMVSCLHEENNIFDQSAALRLEEAIKADREVLIAAPNGWLANYYPEKEHSVGGYAMYFKFLADGTVDMACEITTKVPAQTISNSQWDIKPDLGPVLSFDIYNPVIHYFSDPSNADIDGFGGDYDFIISKVSDDKNQVELRGKKNDNKLILTKVVSDIDPIDYLEKTADIFATVAGATNFKLIVDTKEIGTGTLVESVTGSSLKARRIDLKFPITAEKDTTISVYFTYNPTGISLYEPLEITGVEAVKFTWNDEAKTYTSTDGKIQLVSTNKFAAKPTLPPGAGTDASPYLVTTEGHLLYIGNALSAVYKMTADIELEGAWIPVTGAFTGKFYGDGHAIKNILINSDGTYVGFFSELGTGAYIKGLNIVGGNINSTKAGDESVRIGAITGNITGAVTITECSNSATISTVSNKVNSANYAAGGLVGFVDGTDAVTISSSFNRGDVKGGSRVGGILGSKAGEVTCTIINCYSNATITGTSTSTNDAIGGIVGSVAAVTIVVENCYSAGNVVASGSTRAIGGIAGGRNMSTDVTIKNSVALLDKLQIESSGSTYFFRIQGYNAKATLTNNYANSAMQYLYSTSTSKTPSKATVNDQDGANVTLADAKTVAWYAANLPTWDFTNTWKITGSNLPSLKWEN